MRSRLERKRSPRIRGVELARNSYPRLRSFKHLKTIALLDALKNGIGLVLNMRALHRTKVSKVKGVLKLQGSVPAGAVIGYIFVSLKKSQSGQSSCLAPR